jgi:group II intron reverse transcriptase/maturase
VLSESTLKKLQGIRKCSINGHKVKNLLQIVLNAPDLWEQAYGNIYNNKGGMTPGVDGLTMDGYSHERAANVRELLRENRYVPPPVVRAYVSKPNGKQRPLGKPTANDKQVQEVWRMILESIYEPVFKDSSHGFRMQKSCHTALKRIESTWQGTKWFIEFDIEGFFNNIDHKILMELLEKKIDDEKFLNLIRKIVKAGYVEEWKYNETYSGTPQGGIRARRSA